MSVSVPIPQTNVGTGDTTYGPVSVTDDLTQAQVSIDRTVHNGMNSKTASTTLAYHIQVSTDGGVTFPFGGQTGPAPCGQFFKDPEDGGGLITISSFGVSLPPGTGRWAKVTITCANGPVTIAGSMELT